MYKPSLVIFFLLLIPMINCIVYGQIENEEQISSHTNYKIGIYLLNVGKVDLQNGSYDLDFYLWISSDDADFTKEIPKFEFMNGKASIEPITIEKNYYEARVKGTFLKNLDFHSYPFEQHTITVEIESDQETNKFTFIPDIEETAVDNLVNFPGWHLKQSKSEVLEHEYSDGKLYSRYVFSLDVERFFVSSFLKTLLPIIIITTIAMLAFWMSPSNFAPRIGLAASTLLAAVAAHLNAANQLPPVGYLTLLDKIMIIAYALFLNNLLSMVIQMRLIDHDKKDEAIKINAKMRKLMPILIVILFFALFFL